MKNAKSFTQEMSWLHTWSGLIFGWLLVPIFVTGSLSVFFWEIRGWARPEAHAMQVAEPAALIEFAETYLKKTAPDSRLWRIGLPGASPRDPFFIVSWLDKGGRPGIATFAYDGSGAKQVVTDTRAGTFFVYFHYALNILPRSGNPIGFLIVGAAGIAFLVGLVSGIVTHKRIFKDFFTFRPKAKSQQRSWLDAHNVLGVLPLPFHFMIVLTGLAVYCYAYIPAGIHALYNGSENSFHQAATFNVEGAEFSEFNDLKGVEPGAVAPNAPLRPLLNRAETEFGPELVGSVIVRDPGRANAVVEMFGSNNHDSNRILRFSNTPRIAFEGTSGRVIRVVHDRPIMGTIVDTGTALHMAWFGGTPMRLLYLVSGMAGAVMMATGQLLFTMKRREKKVSAAAERFFRIVDAINVATIAGVCFACMAHLWAARLLPYGMAGRADWEVNIFFIAWGLAFVHSALRAPRAAWIEQLAATAILCIGLPVLGFMVPNSNIVAMIASGDWKTAGVDLGSVAFGIFFAATAWVLNCKPAFKLLPHTSLERA